jgi:hypothetical protein
VSSKPSYSTSKQMLWCSAAAAWAVIFALTVGAVLGSDQAVGFGTVTIPCMCALIASMLGIHRHYGSLDMKTMTDAVSPPGEQP